MKRQNKLDDGLNRLFSSPKRNPADESPESNEEPVKEKKAEAKKSAPKKTADKPEPKAPPKSHLIPVPSKPTLPLQMPFSDEGDESEIVESIEEKIPAPAATKPVEKTKEKSEAFSKESTASPDIKTEESKTKVVASPAVEQKPKTKVTSTNTSTNTSTSSANIPAGETPDVSNSGKKHSSTDEQIVVFTLANQYYGVNISVVESIIKMQSITVVPRAPHYIEGVTNLRGTVVPVVSLHKRLNIPVVDESTTSRIIVVNSHGVNAGLIVDEVNSVSYISGKDIEQVAQTLTSIDSSYIRAIAKSEEKLIVLLSLENVLKERT